jgi:uncharacterized protein YcfJ
MKKFLLLAALAGVAATASAQEQGRVLSATPIIQQVAVPRQVCGNETVYSGSPNSGAGAVMGAIAGGAMGNAVGGGSGRAAATALGVIGGALVGNQIEGSGPPRYYQQQRCSTETYYENRTVGYNVTYEYAGRQYNTQTSQDPGRWIPLSVQPMQGTYSTNQINYDAQGSGYGYGQAQPGVVTTYPSPPAYIVAPPAVTIEYNGYPPPRYPHRPYWR